MLSYPAFRPKTASHLKNARGYVDGCYHVVSGKFHKSDLQALFACRSQIMAASPFTNDCRLQRADRWRVLQGSSMLVHGSQVWRLL